MTERPTGTPDAGASASHDRRVPAPQLRETADIWFDTGRDPQIRWDAAGRRFELIDPEDEACVLPLLTTSRRVEDPAQLAAVLADGLAACDFPPTGDGAHRGHVDRALRAVGIDPAEL